MSVDSAGEPVDQRAWLASIVDSSFDAIITKTLDGTIISWNPAAERMYGYSAREAIGRSIRIIVPPDHLDELLAVYDRLKANQRVLPFETKRVTKDGTVLDVALTLSPMRDRTGDVVGASAVARDITDQKRVQEQQQLLLHELDHRVKNVLASVRALAALTLRDTPNAKQFRDAFEGRLDALARTHALLTGNNWQAASLRALAQEVLAPYRAAAGDRLVIAGPECSLTPEIASTLGLALHELATNAGKHGALSRPSGRVEIGWAVEETVATPRLRVTWQERGGPPVSPPARRGFGSKMIERTLASQLGGAVQLRFLRQGVRCVMQIPLPADLDRSRYARDVGP
jgi:PAS domain S-box-containing protein